MSMRVAIITLSDSGYAGQREDKSGPVIRALAEAAGYTVAHRQLSGSRERWFVPVM